MAHVKVWKVCQLDIVSGEECNRVTKENASESELVKECDGVGGV